MKLHFLIICNFSTLKIKKQYKDKDSQKLKWDAIYAIIQYC